MGCDQQNNNRDCGLFSIANAAELALKGVLVQYRMFPRTAGAFQCILLCGICMDP